MPIFFVDVGNDFLTIIGFLSPLLWRYGSIPGASWILGHICPSSIIAGHWTMLKFDNEQWYAVGQRIDFRRYRFLLLAAQVDIWERRVEH